MSGLLFLKIIFLLSYNWAVFLLLSYKSSLCILDTRPNYYWMYDLQIFSPI